MVWRAACSSRSFGETGGRRFALQRQAELVFQILVENAHIEISP
jgi:hypothetical protein